MTPQDAITVLENTSKLCKDIGTKGLASELLEVINVIRDLDNTVEALNKELIYIAEAEAGAGL